MRVHVVVLATPCACHSVLYFVSQYPLQNELQVTILSIRLPERLDVSLMEESRLANQPKSLIVRRALEQFLANQRRDRRLARLAQAAAALDANAAIELAEEALPLDNESLSMAEGAGAADDWSEGLGE